MHEETLIAKSKGTEYHYNLVNEIGDPSQYQELLSCLRFASPDDTVVLHINSPGGDLYTAIQIIHAIKECPCLVVGSAEGMVASGASMIFFACTGLMVNPYCTFLIHDGSGGVNGKVNENVMSSKAVAKLISDVYKDVYSPWLTDKEIAKVLRGQDMYLSSADVEKRIEKVMETQLEETDNQEGDELGSE